MVDNSQRQLHGALLDAEILADVYLLMTGGQAQMFSGGSSQDGELAEADEEQKAVLDVSGLKVISPVPEELEAHEAMLSLMDQHSGGQTLWRR
jgi:DNA polymerase-3 subunit epsilon